MLGVASESRLRFYSLGQQIIESQEVEIFPEQSEQPLEHVTEMMVLFLDGSGSTVRLNLVKPVVLTFLSLNELRQTASLSRGPFLHQPSFAHFLRRASRE